MTDPNPPARDWLSPAMMRPSALALVLALCAPLACGGGDASSTAAAAAVQRLDPSEFRAAAEQQQGLYLDVRTDDEVARGQIPGASHVDVHDPGFEQKVKLLDRKRPVFVYCAAGSRSRDAADRLAQLGFEHVYDLAGGMNAWKGAGLPVELPPDAPPEAPGLTPEAFDAELASQPVVLVDFQTPWCTPCKAMAPVVDELAASYEGRAKVLRVDIDRSEAIAAREKIEGVPVFVVYAKGREAWRGSGTITREALAKQIDAALARG